MAVDLDDWSYSDTNAAKNDDRFDYTGDDGSDDEDLSTTDYGVPSGTVNALTRDGAAESEQLSEMEDEMEGALDSHAVTTTTNSDGSTSVTAESNLGEEVTSTVMPMGMGENVPEPPDLSGLSNAAKAALVGLVVLVVAIVGGN